MLLQYAFLVRFEVPVTASFANAVSCNMTWCCSAKIYGRVGETCCLRLHVPLLLILNVEADDSLKALIDFFCTAHDLPQKYSYFMSFV